MLEILESGAPGRPEAPEAAKHPNSTVFLDKIHRLQGLGGIWESGAPGAQRRPRPQTSEFNDFPL